MRHVQDDVEVQVAMTMLSTATEDRAAAIEVLDTATDQPAHRVQLGQFIGNPFRAACFILVPFVFIWTWIGGESFPYAQFTFFVYHVLYRIGEYLGPIAKGDSSTEVDDFMALVPWPSVMFAGLAYGISGDFSSS
jgi:hypothetical protein